jgi:hypothetical protein
MKTPRFEEMADRWEGKAQFYVLYVREAHANARNSKPLNRAADELVKMDQNGDNIITREEFSGPDQMFAPFDIDNDGAIHSPELLAARKIDAFADVKAPTSMDERMALAKKYREECPGDIPVLVDAIDDAVSTGYGKRPNSAFILGKDGKVTHKFPWANERDIEAGLAELAGDAAPPAPEGAPPDWSVLTAQLDAAKSARKPLLVEFTSPGCPACSSMKAETLENTDVKAALGEFEVTHLGVEDDAAWALFEALKLSSTPAFVVVDPGPKVRAQSQGFQAPDEFKEFLSG